MKDKQWWRDYRKDNKLRLKVYNARAYAKRMGKELPELLNGEEAVVKKSLTTGCHVCQKVGKRRGLAKGRVRWFCEEHFKI